MMNADELELIVDEHEKWVKFNGGKCASLRGADLRGSDLSRANLSRADLRRANLSRASLRGADLRGSDLSGAKLSWTNLRGADLSWADLSWTNMRGADLSGANLSWTNLRGANPSGATGIPTEAEWLQKLDADSDGLIVFKAIGDTYYAPPSHWKIERGSVLTETVNPDRCTECGSGVNFGTEDFVRNAYPKSTIWRCRIAWMDLADVVVPFGTGGNARCSRLTLIEEVNRSEAEGGAK